MGSEMCIRDRIRATKGIQNVGTPHDWEDYEKYKKELDDDTTD